MANTLFEYYQGQNQALPSLSERGKLYETQGLGSASTYQGSAQQNTSLLNALQGAKSGSMNVLDLGKSPNVDGLPNEGTDKSGAIINGLGAMAEADKLANEKKQADALAQQKLDLDRFNNMGMLQGTSDASKTYTQSIEDLKGLQTKETEKTQALGEAYKSSGVENYQKRLDELNLQSAQLQGSYLQGITNTEGKVIPMNFITGQQAQQYKQYATKAATVALEQQALQGNITNAKAIAKEMVDLKYGDIEKQITNQKDLIGIYYDQFTADEKKRADARLYALGQEENRAAQAKADEESKQNTYIEAINSGITDKKVLDNILNASSPEAALKIAGPYIGKTKQELNNLDIAYKQAQIKNIQSDDSLLFANRNLEDSDFCEINKL